MHRGDWVCLLLKAEDIVYFSRMIWMLMSFIMINDSDVTLNRKQIWNEAEAGLIFAYPTVNVTKNKADLDHAFVHRVRWLGGAVDRNVLHTQSSCKDCGNEFEILV